MLGLQTALPIAWEVLSPHMGPERVFALMSAQPAVIAKLRVTDPRGAGHGANGHRDRHVDGDACSGPVARS